MKLLNSESIAHNKQYRFEILDILNAFKPLCDEFYLLFDDIGKHSLVGSAVEKHIIEPQVFSGDQVKEFIGNIIPNGYEFDEASWDLDWLGGDVYVNGFAVPCKKYNLLGIDIDTEEQFNWLSENYPEVIDSCGFIRHKKDVSYNKMFIFKSPETFLPVRARVVYGDDQKTDKITLIGTETQDFSYRNHKRFYRDFLVITRSLPTKYYIEGDVSTLTELPQSFANLFL